MVAGQAQVNVQWLNMMVDKGKILTLGHHNGVYTDKKSKEGDNLRKLTKNVLVYLAENSEFLAVESANKLTTAWAKLKK